MKIIKAGSAKSSAPSPDYFTGQVRSEAVFSADAPARAKGVYVTFEARARTNWHTHPLGQTLIITHGRGFVQVWGEKAVAVTVGDVVSFNAGEKHWHGASNDAAMTHLAIGEFLDGVSATWMERVDDSQYETATQA